MSGEIYLNWCPASGKGYVGQTSRTFMERWAGHVKCARSARTPNYNGLMAKAIRKYGVDAFEHQVLAIVSSQTELDNLEKIWIILLQTKDPNGYNLTDGGDSGTAGHTVSPEARAKISAAAKAQWRRPEVRAKYAASRKGQHYPKIAAAKTGLKQSAETIAKRIAKNTGRKRTPEQRARMAKAARERGRTNG